MPLHDMAFEYLKPTDEQMETMSQTRLAFKEFTEKLGFLLPDGPDKTYVMRMLRDVAMWANVCITRNADGSPRT